MRDGGSYWDDTREEWVCPWCGTAPPASPEERALLKAEEDLDLGSGITDEQIEKLRDESAQAGDHAMALICDRALGNVVLDEDTTIEALHVATFLSPAEKRRIRNMSVDDCRDECERVIRNAQAW